MTISKTALPTIAVLGAGSWGTALALVLARNGFLVKLWSFEPQQAQAMQQARCNMNYLPAHPFPENLQVTHSLIHALAKAKDILIVVPSQGFRDLIGAIKPHLKPSMRIVWGTKGLDASSHQLLHEVVKEILGKLCPIAILSGPSFAGEVAKGLPTAVVAASYHAGWSHDIQTYFANDFFRVYTSEDIIGVQLGGAVKNVMAIASGISDGLGFGANARSALITRSLAEMVRLGTAMGAQAATFMGLSGLGDLILTCTDNQSRNRRFGLALGQDLSPQTALQQIGQVVEGATTAREVAVLAEKWQVEMPIVSQVCAVLQGDISAKMAVQALLSRPLRAEEI